jgi:ubiquinone/menaquinone biosynthesis C-methylase UbiE
VTDSDPSNLDVPLSHLAPQEKEARAGSFGEVASHYDRFRPGPPRAAVDWILPTHMRKVVDLGAGTGALAKLLVDKADAVVAVEPDDRMRAVLSAEVPGITAVAGQGESMPLPDSSVDAVLASSSWHWMDLIPTLHEVARILVPGGTLGALWSGPDPEGPFLVQAQTLLAGQATAASEVAESATAGSEAAGSESAGRGEGEFSSLIMGDARRPASSLEIPPGVPFDQPEHEVFTWDVALNADDLIGLLGTFSWIITMPDDTRGRVIAEARRLLGELLGVEGDVTVDVAFRCEAWRCRRFD